MKALYFAGHSEIEQGNARQDWTEHRLARTVLQNLDLDLFQGYDLAYTDFIVEKVKFIQQHKNEYDCAVDLNLSFSDTSSRNFASITYQHKSVRSYGFAYTLQQILRQYAPCEIYNTKEAGYRHNFFLEKSDLPAIILEPVSLSYHGFRIKQIINLTQNTITEFNLHLSNI